MTETAWAAIVLAGGTSRRMGARDKTRLAVAGASMLDRVIAAARHAGQIVVVGDPRPTAAPVSWTREQPAGGGPAAALAAGLSQTIADVVVVLAADLPLLEPATIDRVVTAIGSSRGVVAVDPHGREQWLCSAWRREALLRAPLEPHGSLGRALAPLNPVRVPLEESATWLDCDTPGDLRRALRLLNARGDKVASWRSTG